MWACREWSFFAAVWCFFPVVRAAEVSRGRRFLRHERGPSCAGSACCGMAHYPVAGTKFSAVFDVPEIQAAPVDRSVTDFIYFNIFFAAGAPSARMNQFVPQLMLGEPLCGSTGSPDFKPVWADAPTYIFGAQYFFEFFNATANATVAHAAVGETYPVDPGERLATTFELSDGDSAWTLTMAVVGDATRTSVLRVPEPYMGLLRHETTSWTEGAYDKAFVNSCWENYGMRDRAHYPSSGSTSEMRVQRDPGATWPWFTAWTEDEVPTCDGHPESNITEEHNETHQLVTWRLFWDDKTKQASKQTPEGSS